jgi:4-hydroxy-tetrahydrodipicolinate synthase
MPTSAFAARQPLAVPTAMHDDAALDHDAQAALVAAVADAGADAIVVLDLAAGEVDTLDDDERAAVVRASRRGAGGLPLVAGVGSGGPSQLLAARRAADAGVEALLVPLSDGTHRRAEHLEALAALGLPLVLHHHPGAAGATIGPDELGALAREVDAAVLLEATPVPDLVEHLVRADVTVLGGLAGLFLPEELDAGASGSAAASAVPERLVGVLRAHRAGDPHSAREDHLLACGYLRLEAGSTGTVVRKEAWRQRGPLSSGRARRGAPLGAATKAAITRRLVELDVDLRAPWPGA